MAGDGDYLEKLWVEAIDVESKTKWVDKCLGKADRKAGGLFEGVVPALQRILVAGALRTDVELLGAFVRYETVFGVLCALDDPGLGKSKINGLQKAFQACTPTKKKPRNKVEAFVQWLWETESFVNDDGKWLRGVTKKDVSFEPFDGLFPALKRLLKTTSESNDIGCFLGWNRYQACSIALRLLEDAGFESADDPLCLHEMLLTSFPADSESKAKKFRAKPEVLEPLWRIKSAQTIAFSPDSKTLAVAGASSPVRLYDLASGRERHSCDGIRVHIYRIIFSSDGKQIAAGQIHKAITVSEAKSGKLIHKLKRTEDEISGLEYLPGGELICSSWCNELAIFDSVTGKVLPPLGVGGPGAWMKGIVALQSGTKLAALWNGTDNHQYLTVWSWPERQRLLEVVVAESYDNYGDHISASPDGRMIAVTGRRNGILLFEASSGVIIRHIEVKEAGYASFTCDGRHLVCTSDGDKRLCIWDWKGLREVRGMNFDHGCFSLKISSNGEYVAVAGYRGALVWRLPLLLIDK